MATTSIAQLVNRPNTARAVAQARQECAHDARWLRAVNRAAVNLETCPWQFDGETLLIQSATSDRRYTVTADGCACKAFWDWQPCWHRAARRLLIKAAQMATQPPVELVFCFLYIAQANCRQYGGEDIPGCLTERYRFSKRPAGCATVSQEEVSVPLRPVRGST